MPATSTVNMLSKLGADLRWFLEREGVDPERCVVSIGVAGEVERSRVISAMLRDFDARTMRHFDAEPAMVVAHGVPLFVVAKKAHA